MNIIILGPAYPYRGGIAAFGERLAHQFQNEGHSVEMYTFTLQYPDFLFPGKTQYSTESAPKDLAIYRKINSCNPFNWLCVGNEIRKKAPDMLVVGFWLPFMAPCMGTISRIVRKNKKTKVVAILHNLIPHEQKFTDKIFDKYFCKSVDGFLAMSKAVEKDIDVFDKKKPRCFSPHPLYDHFGEPVSKDMACKELGLDAHQNYLLFFGLIRDYKGLDWLLEAFAKSEISKNENIKLIVAGEFYSDKEKYFELEQKLNLKGKIIWHSEFIADSKVRYYFCAADMIVQPYKTATQSGVTQIAYHFEKPMLVTNVGGLAEIVPNNKVGYAVEPNTYAIASALSDFYANKKDFLQGIKDEKQKYSWQTMSKAIRTLTEK